MAKVLFMLPKAKVEAKEPHFNWRTFVSIILLGIAINLSILSQGLFLKEILTSCAIVAFLIIFSTATTTQKITNK